MVLCDSLTLGKYSCTQHTSCTVTFLYSWAREGGRRERARAPFPGVARVQHQRALERVRALLLRSPHARRVLRAHRFARAPYARARLQTRGTAATRNGLSTHYSSFLLFCFFYKLSTLHYSILYLVLYSNSSNYKTT